MGGDWVVGVLVIGYRYISLLVIDSLVIGVLGKIGVSGCVERSVGVSFCPRCVEVNQIVCYLDIKVPFAILHISPGLGD